MSKAYYVVQVGRQTSVLSSWKECEAKVKAFPNAQYNKFSKLSEAEAFAKGSTSPVRDVPTSLGLSMAPSPSPEKSTTNSRGKKRVLSPEIADQSFKDVVYCDGACKGNGQRGSVAGIGVWWGSSDARNLSERCPGDQTNNRAELFAIARVLETAPKKKIPLQIMTDSQYSCKCFESWLPIWRSNGYRTAGNQPVKNLDLILYIKSLLDAREHSGQTIILKHVRGHVGIEGNEAADALANDGTLLPPEPERAWKALENEVRRNITASQNATFPSLDMDAENSSRKTRKVSFAGTPGSPRRTVISSPPKNATTSKLRSSAKFGSPLPPTITVRPEDVDYNVYADCLLDEDQLWKDLDD